MVNYYDDEEYCVILSEKKVFKNYHVNEEMIKNGLKNLRKKGIPKRNTDFTPKSGVLGELNSYFVKNNITY